MSPWTILAGVLLLGGAFGLGYYEGHKQEANVLTAYKETIAANQAKANAAVSKQKAESAIVTTKIVTQYVPQIQVVHDKGATIIRQVKVYVPISDNARYLLPIGFVRLHDAAASGMPLPAASSSVLAQPSPVGISTAASAIASNYQLCRTEREKYEALWQWATSQANVTAKQSVDNQ